MILIAIAIIFCGYWIRRLNKNYSFVSLTRRIKTIDGTPMDNFASEVGGIFDSNLDLLSRSLEQLFDYGRDFAFAYKRGYFQYFLFTPVYNIIDAEEAELILNDSRFLCKGLIYDFLRPFLRNGMLTSHGKMWHTRRRLLTPTFHFNILQQFMDVFKKESNKFMEILNEHIQEDNSNAVISLSELIPRFTLNNICETALGVSLDDCLDGDEYRENISKVEILSVKRIRNPLNIFDWYYFHSSNGKENLKVLEKLHAFSSGIIEKRRELFDELLKTDYISLRAEENEEDNIYRKQRYAMLDSLLRAEKEGLIDHAGICEEVDTFMFEGFDTTSMNLIFTLFCLSLYPDMQQFCYEEIQHHIDDNISNLNMQQLNNLKYLDCFLKETQRLYPSVPLITRQCDQDLVFREKILLPKGTQINIHIYDVLRNPKHYDQPDVFRPERFFPEQAKNRHPYAFIPFSAGQRNCIGQKFAVLEVKTLLVYILKKFILDPITKPESLYFSAGLLLRASTNIQIKLRLRT
ncbi:cytochrome P450 4p1-like [Haematobia irritans]|uniref:cytochrome P450 4p1-like n=1 Tax=Haematobia irritans TaxID=7368 RepID=UPI003F4F7365